MKKKTRGKRLLSILLACIMMISLVPTTVFAAQKYLDKDISESNWTYTGSTKTLQLSNYNGSDRFYTPGNVDLTVELVGTNTITYDINNTNDYSYYAICGGNVTFTGSGTLNINLATGSDDYRRNLSAICATKKLTIENNVTLNINIVNTYVDSNVYGVYALNGIEVKDSAKINVDVTALNTKNPVYGLYNQSGEILIGGTGTKTVTMKGVDGTEPTADNYSIFNYGYTAGTGNGNITIKGTGKTTLNGNSMTHHVYSNRHDNNTEGVIAIKENATVEINGGTYGILNYSAERTSATADIVVKDSKLTIKNVQRGIGSAFNGINLDNSDVDITANVSAIYTDKVYNSYDNSSTYGLRISGGKPVILETNDDSSWAIYNKQTDESSFNLSSGGSILLKGGRHAVSQYHFPETILGTNTVISEGKGTISDATVRGILDNTIGKVVLELSYNNSSTTSHAHSWAATWSTDGTHHWHECTETGCNITDNSQKDGYAAHSGGTANCVDKAVCSTCDESYGTTNPDVHRSTSWTAKYDGTHHWTELNCCNAILNAKQAHTYDDDADTTCNGCDYVRTITHTCGATTLNAVDKVEATHFTEGKEAYYECSCGEYYEDATATTKITDISTWGVINKTPHQLSEWKHDDANTKHWKECTIPSCTHKEQEAAHAGGTATCQGKKTCTECGEKYGEFGAHNYDITTWGYKGADGHAHYCKTTGCTEHDTITAHIPGAAATEEAAQTCTVCGYELAAKLEHAPMLVEGYEATTEAPGKKDYYHCDSCGRNYEDPTSLKEITGDVEEWRYIPMIIAIIEGNGQVWTKGTTVDLTFKSNANFADFTRVEVDGAKVDASNYTKSEGSTIVTLKASFLETLSVGEHTIVIVSANDVPEAKFTVKAAATGGNTGNEQNPDTGVTSPQTGDSSNMFLWIALLFVSLGGLTTTVVYKKRKAVKE